MAQEGLHPRRHCDMKEQDSFPLFHPETGYTPHAAAP